jgi:hypothetical protein
MPEQRQKKASSFWYRNSLSLVILFCFLIFLTGQAFTGWKEHNDEMLERGGHTVDFVEYLGTAHFVEATFENWESEFLQMGMYVIFTVFLRQLGSSESKPVEGEADVDRVPEPHEKAPWPVKKGGFWLAIYKNSLSLAFLLLFLISFALHACSSHREYNEEQILKGEQVMSMGDFLCSSRLWFESFQNWQSEFIAVLSIVVLSIYLRQQGSPESKPVDAAHDETGD